MSSPSERDPIATPFPLNKQQARALIQTRILKHKQCIKELEMQFNALSHTAQVPNEILCNIFLELWAMCLDWPEGVPGEEDVVVKRDLRWLAVTQVCCRWRQVSLNLPPLWSHIQIASHQPTHFPELQLQRSKGHALSIQIHLSNPSIVKNTRTLSFINDTLLLQHMERLKSLDITGCTKATDQVVRKLSGPTPLLEVLNFHHSVFIIRNDLLSSGAPRLRDVTLERCEQLPWDWPILVSESLVHLRIQLRTSANFPEWYQLKFVLEKNTSLETLHLIHALPVDWPQDPSTTHPFEIDFPSLKELGLTGSPSSICALLRSLRIPRSTCLRVETRINSSHQFNDIIQAFSTSRSSKIQPTNLTIERILTDISRRTYKVTLHDNESGKGWTNAPTPLLDLCIHCDAHEGEAFMQFFPFSDLPNAAVQFEDLLELRLATLSDSYRGIPEAFWFQLLPSQRIHTLQLDRVSLKSLEPRIELDNEVLTALASSPAEVEIQSKFFEDIAKTRWLPVLRKLSLSGASDLNDRLSLSTPVTLLERLVQNIKLREVLGAPVSDMDFSKCRIGPVLAERLRALGARVVD